MFAGNRRDFNFTRMHKCQNPEDWKPTGYENHHDGRDHNTTSSDNHRGNKNRSLLIYFMLYTIAIILIVLWLLGLLSGYTLGAFIHILLVIAVIIILVNLITGRRSL